MFQANRIACTSSLTKAAVHVKKARHVLNNQELTTSKSETHVGDDKPVDSGLIASSLEDGVCGELISAVTRGDEIVLTDGEGALQAIGFLEGGVEISCVGASCCFATGFETTGGGGITTSNVVAEGFDDVESSSNF